MAYPRPPYDSRPSPYEPEQRSRSSWDNMQRPPPYPSMPSPSHHNMPTPSPLDLESESSDVSDSPGIDYHLRIRSSFPTALPPPPAKHLLESLDAIDVRLRELQHVEDLNIKKRDQLRLKRARKDDRIRHRRDAQDAQIKAMMDLRARRDDRITRRRKAEDEAFDRFDQDLEEEENNLRRRQKRLKRGLPVEDLTTGPRIPSASMSPPGVVYSAIPPPAKRHQTGPPGQNDSPITSTPRPSSHGGPSAPNSAGPNPPPYAFLQSSHAPAPAPAPSPYGRSPTVSSQSPLPPSGSFQPIPRSHQPHSELPPLPYGINGHPPSPHSSRPSIAPGGPILNTAPPPRQSVSNYDTRPPPVASGFATINAPPPASGFAPINPRSTATPPAPVTTPLAKNTEHERTNGNTRPYGTEGTPTGGSAMTSSKRTPSTTHPYQMSEAFANRHHHCERVDHLHRGIWTSHGPGGTKEMPTGPPQEMYLRCNHDGCRRIDWKTVHGLQCHIVKNHEQPKGTIGSLEKALDRYGIPIAEIEAYEREHGDGTGGTMADPKNFKLKIKSRESTEKADGRRLHSQMPTSNGFKPNMPMPLGHLAQPHHGSPASVRSLPHEETHDSDTDSRGSPANATTKAPSLPPLRSGFPAVNGAYVGAPPPPPPPPRPVEHGDQRGRGSSSSPRPSDPNNAPRREPAFWQMWPVVSEAGKPPPPPNTSIPPPGSNSFHPGPTSAPTQQVNSPPLSHGQQNLPPSGPAPAMPTPAIPVNQSPPSHERAQPSQQDQYKTEPERTVTAPPSTNHIEPAVSRPEPVQDTHMTGTSVPQAEPTPARPSTATSEKETVKAEVPKEVENAKSDTAEPNRVEPRSPETSTRRMSIAAVRSSRRSSVAASRAEKEKEREREEAAAVAAAAAAVVAKAEAEAQAQAEREKGRVDREEDHKHPEPEHEKPSVKDGEQFKAEDSDDPDTITAAVPSSLSKEQERERERDGREKTTPSRRSNGRFLRKNR